MGSFKNLPIRLSPSERRAEKKITNEQTVFTDSHPDMQASVNEDKTEWPFDTDVLLEDFGLFVPKMRQITAPHIIEESASMQKSIIPAKGVLKKLPQKAITKAGDGPFEKEAPISASLLDKAPERNIPAADFAPMGNPATNPVNQRANTSPPDRKSALETIENGRATHLVNSVFIKKDESTANGKSEGITPSTQRASPKATPDFTLSGKTRKRINTHPKMTVHNPKADSLPFSRPPAIRVFSK
jgi:hypothetical protein